MVTVGRARQLQSSCQEAGLGTLESGLLGPYSARTPQSTYLGSASYNYYNQGAFFQPSWLHKGRHTYFFLQNFRAFTQHFVYTCVLDAFAYSSMWWPMFSFFFDQDVLASLQL